MNAETIQSLADALKLAADRGRTSVHLSDMDLYTDLSRQTVVACLRNHLEEVRTLSGLPKLVYSPAKKATKGCGGRPFKKSPGAGRSVPARIYLQG